MPAPRQLLAWLVAAALALQGCAVPGKGPAIQTGTPPAGSVAEQPAPQAPAPEPDAPRSQEPRSPVPALALLAIVILAIAFSRALAKDTVRALSNPR